MLAVTLQEQLNASLTPFLVDTHRIPALAGGRVDSLPRLLDGLRAILDREAVDSTGERRDAWIAAIAEFVRS